jgi:hypothetical protein
MQKQLTFHLNPVTVIVTGATEKELIENAKKAVIFQMQLKFPKFQCSISDLSALTLETAFPGMIVEDSKDGILGIVTSIGKNRLYVTLTGNRDVSGDARLFKKSNASFEEARSRREDFMKNLWTEGDSCYGKVNGEIKELVVGKKVGKKWQLWIINGDGKGISITESQLSLLKEEKSEIK